MSGRGRKGKRRTVAPRKRGGPTIEQRKTGELEPGDVIYWAEARHVVIERAQELPDAEASSRWRRLLIAGLTANGNIGGSHQWIAVSSERSFVIAERVEI